MDANSQSILHKKKLFFFFFTHPFLQNIYISLSILHIYSIKYSFFYNFLLFPPSLPLSLTDPSLPTITPHPASIITTQPPSSRKTNLVNPKLIQSQTHSSLSQPETHWWFDQHGLMIRETFVWWFDDLTGVVGDQHGLMIYRRQWFNDRGNGGMIWSNEERESEVRWPKPRDKEREEIIKILNASATVTMHICTITVVIVHLCTILHPLMWVFFWPKCVKWRDFCILKDFASTDVNALKHVKCSHLSHTHTHTHKGSCQHKSLGVVPKR